MSTRKPVNVVLFTSASMSTSAPTVCEPKNVQHADGVAIQLVIDALPTLTASVVLEGSCDPEIRPGAPNSVANWSILTGSHRNVMFSGSGNTVFWTWDHVYFNHIRVKVTTMAGSGSIGSGRMNAKG